MAQEFDQIPAIVIDNGSGFIKAGLAGDDAPRSILKTVIGRPKQPGLMVGMDQKEFYIGDEAMQKASVLNLSYPVDYGATQNWDDIEKIWGHIFYNELHVTPDEHAVMLTEICEDKKQNREKAVEIMFEQFSVNSLFIAVQQVLALMASGRTTGIVLDSGYALTHTVPIYEGFALTHALQQTKLAGRDITEQLEKLILESDKNLGNSPENRIESAIFIKEFDCYISTDYEAEMKSFAELHKQVVCKLPDGGEIQLGNSIFKAPEILFSPSKANKDLTGIHESTFQSIMKCDVDIRKDLYGNIVMAGGSTMFKQLDNRLTKEIVALAPSTMKIKVIPPPQRKLSTWIGGSILSSLQSFKPMFIKRNEYSEGGVGCVHRKCF